MIDILNWFSVSGWRLVGLLIFVYVLGMVIVEIAKAIRGNVGDL